MRTTKDVKCESCGKIHPKSISEIRKSKTNRFFCCRSCAATYNNSIKPKRIKKEKSVKIKVVKEKRCCKCKELLNKENTYKNNRSQLCKECFKQYCSDRWIKLKQKAIEYKGGRCEDCNGVFSYELYDFHHLDPSQKKYTWPKMRLKNWEIIKTELDKCALLCSNCHRVRHSVFDKKDYRKKIKEKEVLKRGISCKDCGGSFQFQVYDFHHEDPKIKKFNLSQRSCLNDETVDEFDKCVMLCANCHRLRHKMQGINFDK